MRSTIRTRRRVVWSVVAGAWIVAPPVAQAYIGPGAGISVVGTALAFLGAVIFAIIGFVWYPLKRLLAFIRSNDVRNHDDRKAPLS
jgi:uncharacterized membrane protein